MTPLADMVPCDACFRRKRCARHKKGASQCAQIKVPRETIREIAVDEARRRIRIGRAKAAEKKEEFDPAPTIEYLHGQYQMAMVDEAGLIAFEREKAGGPRFLDSVDLGSSPTSTVDGEQRGGAIVRAGCSQSDLAGIASLAAKSVVDCLLKCTQPDSVDCSRCRANDCAKKKEERDG